MSTAKFDAIDVEIERLSARLAIEYVRLERQAVYGDLKSIDKLKSMRQQLNAAYKVLEEMEASS